MDEEWVRREGLHKEDPEFSQCERIKKKVEPGIHRVDDAVPGLQIVEAFRQFGVDVKGVQSLIEGQ